MEELPVLKKDSQGNLTAAKVECATLTLFGPPEALIRVSLPGGKCEVAVMEARPVPGQSQTAYYSVAVGTIPPQTDALANSLNRLIQDGLFMKTPEGLVYTPPKKN